MKRAVQNAQKRGPSASGCSARVAWAAPRWPAPSGTAKAACHCTTLRADIDYGFREDPHHLRRIGVKVWIYKGDILPYKIQAADKITREAAMAVGGDIGPGRARQVVSSSRPADWRRPTPVDPHRRGEIDESASLVKEADPELERLLAEEEAIERSVPTPTTRPLHFRPGDSD